MPDNPANAPVRRLLVGIGLVVSLVALFLLLPRLLDPAVLPVDDFAEYWAAGKLNLHPGNPYDPNQLYELQKGVGLQLEDPIMMWNPPWTLTFVMPFGIGGYPASRLAWLVFHTLLVVLCADFLWRTYGGSSERRWLAWVVALSFTPTIIAFKSGQISPLILLGLTGFLVFCQRKQEAIAGVFLILATVKPHLVYLVGAGFVLWALERRRWSALAGGVVALAVATGIPLLFNPEVLRQYQDARPGAGTERWITTTWGTLLRMGLGEQRAWLIFVPTLAGLLWFVPYWLKQRSRWDWQEQLPLLLLVSVCTASYGWLGDQVILLLALVPMACWVERCRPETAIMAVMLYVAGNLADLLLNIFQPTHQLLHLWTAPAMLIGFLLLRGHGRKPADSEATPAESERAYA